MDKFSLYVLVVTIVCLIIALTIIGLIIKNNKYSTAYPPIIDTCPDYWYSSYYDVDSGINSTPSDSCKNSAFGCCPDNVTSKTDDVGTNCALSKCYNVQKLGTQSDSCYSVMDFSKYTKCEKQKWAKQCNLTWDGITNMPDACPV